jgi:hypothetical protein
MTAAIPGLLALGVLAVALALLTDRPRLMWIVALAGCLLPFLLPGSEPLLRAAAAILVCLFFVKALQVAAGHERPRGTLDSLLFLVIPALVRWESPRRPDPARAARSLLTSLGQVGLAFLLMSVVLRLDVRNPVQLITTQIGIYLGLAAACNIAVIPLSLRGLDYDDPFDNPLAARTPSEFWGRRWNTWVNYMLYRYVFVPSGGQRNPVRGTLAAFALSAALHEAFVVAGTRTFSGWMAGFFLVQGGLTALTSRSRPFRRLARRAPVLTWALTLVAMLTTGTMFVRGADGIDPSDAWRRCCRQGP